MVQTIEAKYVPEGAKLLEGRYLDIMPALLREGLVPITPAQVMDLRNKNPTADENSPWRTWLDTDAGFADDRKKVYLFPHSKVLRELTHETRLTDYGVKLPNTKGAKSFNKEDLILRKDLTEKEALAHPLWLALAEGDKERLGTYVQNAFKLGKDTFKYDKNMGFYVPEDNQPILRAVVLGRLDDWSGAVGDGLLDSGGARLVGVRQSGAPKAHSASKNGSSDLEHKLGVVALKAGMQNPEELSKALEFYRAAERVYSKKR